MGGRDVRYSNGNARRKARARVLAAYDTCWLCGQRVDKSLPAGHPMAPEVDEVVPVSLGGSPTDFDNLRLAHRICNERRSNRMPVPRPRPGSGGGFPTSGRW